MNKETILFFLVDNKSLIMIFTMLHKCIYKKKYQKNPPKQPKNPHTSSDSV